MFRLCHNCHKHWTFIILLWCVAYIITVERFLNKKILFLNLCKMRGGIKCKILHTRILCWFHFKMYSRLYMSIHANKKKSLSVLATKLVRDETFKMVNWEYAIHFRIFYINGLEGRRKRMRNGSLYRHTQHTKLLISSNLHIFNLKIRLQLLFQCSTHTYIYIYMVVLAFINIVANTVYLVSFIL